MASCTRTSEAVFPRLYLLRMRPKFNNVAKVESTPGVVSIADYPISPPTLFFFPSPSELRSVPYVCEEA